ncbi:DNA translocase FtsK [bacterium]|nr:DNA translocase FtsK [bacterium]
MAKSTSKSTSKPSGKAVSPSQILQDRTVHLVLGGVLVLLGLFLFGALVSFYAYWKIDQSEVEGGVWTLLNSPEFQVRNVFGKVGAAIAHRLAYGLFGIGAFAWVFVLIRLGLAVAFRFRSGLFKHVRYALYAMAWFPVLMAMVLGPDFPQWSGAGGWGLWSKASDWLGVFGAGLIHLGLGVGFLAFHFRWSPEQMEGWWARWRSNKSNRASVEPKNGAVEPAETTPPEPPLEPAVASPPLSVQKPQESEEIRVFTLGPDPSDPELQAPPPPVAPNLPPRPSEQAPAEPMVIGGEDGLAMTVESVSDEVSLDEETYRKLIAEHGEFDPKLELSGYRMPGLDLMKDYGSTNIHINPEELELNKNRIVDTLRTYSIEIAQIKATIGPTVTLYEIVPAPGVRISKIKNLEDDIALSLSAEGIRIIAPIPGKGTIGIEVPNAKPSMVSMRSVLSSEKFQQSEAELPLVLGKTISNETFVADLTKMPHLLMAGATGQGKSVGLNVILTSLLYRKHPSQVKFVLVDPKKVELTLFNAIERHYLATLPDSAESIITDTKKVVYTLNSLCVEMDNRYELLKNAQARNLVEYNAKFVGRRLNPNEGHRFLPYIVLVVDEFADLIMTAGKEVETPIARLAQLARAIGIHLIIATQRPSVNVITGIIKANFPARLAFRVTSKIDSRTILDAGGAERLIGKGDMLLSLGSEPVRIQCAFVDTPEIERLVGFIGGQRGYPTAYQLPEFESEEGGGGGDMDWSERDSMFEEAARVVVIHQQGSTSLLQRKLKLGYGRAGRIMDQLEAAGIIGPFEGSKARQVLIPDEFSLEQLLNSRS